MKPKKSLATLALILAVVPALQGCFPAAVAGAGATALLISDRRTTGAYVDDQAIELKGSNRIEERFHGKVHFNITSFNRMALLTGEAPDEATREEMGTILQGVDNVRAVVNQVQIAGISSLASRSNDSYLTGKVKARFIDMNVFPAQVVKVTTEGGTTYLMGIVTQREADRASEIAATTGGVRQVVRVFEYVPREKAWELDHADKAADPKKGAEK